MPNFNNKNIRLNYYRVLISGRNNYATTKNKTKSNDLNKHIVGSVGVNWC